MSKNVSMATDVLTMCLDWNRGVLVGTEVSTIRSEILTKIVSIGTVVFYRSVSIAFRTGRSMLAREGIKLMNQ